MSGFIHDASLNLPTLTQHNAATGRVYRVEDGPHAGEEYPSITRMLGSAPKPWLKKWQERVGIEEARRISQQATSRGTALHTLSEHYLDNNTEKYDAAYERAEIPVRELWSKLRPWLHTHVTRIYGLEASLYSHQLKVAGRTDMIAEVDGVLSIVDFKNSRRPKSEGQVQDYYLQGTFYACALFEMTGRKVDRIIFPVVSPERLQIFETKAGANFDRLRIRIAEFYKPTLF